jgi:hypothetical protein
LPTTGTTTEHYKDYALESGVDASLTHSRARVDLRMMADTAWQEEASENQADGAKAAQAALNAERDKIESLALWSTPLVVTTADTVLGLMSNARRSIYTLPAIMSAGPAAATYYRKLPFPFHMMRLEWQSLQWTLTPGALRTDVMILARYLVYVSPFVTVLVALGWFASKGPWYGEVRTATFLGFLLPGFTFYGLGRSDWAHLLPLYSVSVPFVTILAHDARASSKERRYETILRRAVPSLDFNRRPRDIRWAGRKTT